MYDMDWLNYLEDELDSDKISEGLELITKHKMDKGNYSAIEIIKTLHIPCYNVYKFAYDGLIKIKPHDIDNQLPQEIFLKALSGLTKYRYVNSNYLVKFFNFVGSKGSFLIKIRSIPKNSKIKQNVLKCKDDALQVLNDCINNMTEQEISENTGLSLDRVRQIKKYYNPLVDGHLAVEMRNNCKKEQLFQKKLKEEKKPMASWQEKYQATPIASSKELWALLKHNVDVIWLWGHITFIIDRDSGLNYVYSDADYPQGDGILYKCPYTYAYVIHDIEHVESGRVRIENEPLTNYFPFMYEYAQEHNLPKTEK